jgi:hypothetical protein
MGCDIHLHVEARTYSGWHCFHSPRIDRWYSLFARMANVRNCGDVIPIAKPRGLPDDVSDIARIMLVDGDNHSHSWLSAEEWELIAADENYKNGDIRDIVPWRISDKECRDKRILDYRVVFAFDN